MRVMLLPLLAVALGCSSAGPADDARRVLFIGNSLTYTNDLPAMVAAFADHDGRPWHSEALASPNVSLEDHWARGGAREAVASGEWDDLVMQQGPSSLPESQAHLRDWAERWASEARSHGVAPALWTVWPDDRRLAAFPDVIASYATAADASGATLLPAGEAWKRLVDEGDRSVYGPDGFHPSRAGTYLAALVVYGGLTGATLDDLPDLGLPAAQARGLRAAATATLAD